MTSDLTRITDRIRKMMAIANDSAASEGERDNALRMSHALLAKHNLDMSAIASKGGQEEARVEDVLETRSRPWVRTLFHGVAELMFCKYFFSKRGNTDHHYFIGKTSNVVTSKEMADYLATSLRKEAFVRYPDDSAARTSFLKGATHRIWYRCQALRKEAEGASAQEAVKQPGTALVLASVYASEQQANEAYLAARGTKLTKVADRTRDTGRRDAYAAGDAHGRSVGLNRQVKGSNNSQGALR